MPLKQEQWVAIGISGVVLVAITLGVLGALGIFNHEQKGTLPPTPASIPPPAAEPPTPS